MWGCENNQDVGLEAATHLSDKERVCTLEAGRIYPAHCDRGKLSAVDARAALHVPVSFLYHVPVCRACRHSVFAAHGREQGSVRKGQVDLAQRRRCVFCPHVSGGLGTPDAAALRAVP